MRPIALNPLFLKLYDRVCAVTASSAPVLEHLSWVYDGCRLQRPAPAAVRLGLFGDEHHGYTVTVDGIPAAQEPTLLAALLYLDLEILRRPLFLNSPLLGFHASWIARGSRAVLLVGEGGCGKSSLCHQMLSLGFEYGSEEVAAFSADGRLLPLPRRIMFKPDNPLIPQLGIRQDPRNLLAGFDGRFYVLPPGVSLASSGFYDCTFVFLHYQDDGPELEALPLKTLDALQRLCGAAFRLQAMSSSLFAALVGSLSPERAVAVNYSSPGAALAFLLKLADG